MYASAVVIGGRLGALGAAEPWRIFVTGNARKIPNLMLVRLLLDEIRSS